MAPTPTDAPNADPYVEGLTPGPTPLLDVSVVVPMYNEQENARPLVEALRELLDERGDAGELYEAIIIDDGSRDQTLANLRDAVAGDARFTVIEFMRNFGQTAATAAGIDAARGAVVVPMDGDLQTDPSDIPMLVAALDEPGEDGKTWDIVSGWRKERKDEAGRMFFSRVANRIVKRLTWTTEIHDFGCSMKAYRATVIKDVKLYGEMHRFLPAVCKWRGARITERVVSHRPRAAGESKYGMKRTAKVLLDLCTIKFLGDYLTKPIYFFGKLAGVTMLISFASLGVALLQKFNILTEHGHAVMLNDSVLVLFSMMTFLMAVMFVMLGVMSELLMRVYHESQDKAPYKVRSLTVGAGTAVQPRIESRPHRLTGPSDEGSDVMRSAS